MKFSPEQKRFAETAFQLATWILILIQDFTVAVKFAIVPQNLTLQTRESFFLNCSTEVPAQPPSDWWYAPSSSEKPYEICWFDQVAAYSCSKGVNGDNVYSVERPNNQTANLIVNKPVTGVFCCLSTNGDLNKTKACAYVTTAYSTVLSDSTTATETGGGNTASPTTMTSSAENNHGLKIGLPVGILLAIAVIVCIVVTVVCIKRKQQNGGNSNGNGKEMEKLRGSEAKS